MFSLSSSFDYYLYPHPTDMRKSFDSLSGLVQGSMQRNPMSGGVFIFINRYRNKVKLLHWEQGGFVLYYKRLEQGTIELPRYDPKTKSYPISWSMLVMIINGISIETIKHRKRFFINNR